MMISMGAPARTYGPGCDQPALTARASNKTSTGKRVARAAVLCLLALSFAQTVAAEILTIPGSGNPEFVLGELAKAFNSQQQQHQVVIPPTTGTAGALRELAEGSASIGRVGRPLKEAERRTGLTYHPLGRDPIAFVGGSGVTVRAVTSAQVVDVYTGKLTNWRDLGGKPGAVRAIGREVTDASCQAIARDIKAFDDLQLGSNVKVVHLDSQMIDLLDRFPTSFGFLNRSALSAARTKLVVLALDSVEPSPGNMESGRYPLWTELGLVYRESALTEAGRSFLKFVDSPAGAKLLRAHGVVPAAPRT
jgi:phosphate transport system substrate-binding protein